MDVIPTEIEYEGRRYRLVEDSDPLPFLDGVSKPYAPRTPIHTGTPMPCLPTVTGGKHEPTDTGPYVNNNELNFVGQIAL